MIMSGSLFDWDDREKKDVYDFFQGDKFYSLNMTDGQVIHSRTGFSKRDMNGAKSFSAGYQMFSTVICGLSPLSIPVGEATGAGLSMTKGIRALRKGP